MELDVSRDTLKGNLMIFSSVILILVMPKTLFNDSLLNNNLREILCLFLPAVIYGLTTKESSRNIFFIKSINLKTIGLSVIIGVIVYLIGTLVCSVTLNLFGVKEMVDSRYEYYPMWYLIFSNAIIPAICEEFLFRGALFYSYKNVFYITRILVNAIIFLLFHMSYLKIIIILIISIVLSQVIFYTKSILVPIIIHFINNSLCEINGYLKLRGIIHINNSNSLFKIFFMMLLVGILLIVLFKVINKLDLEVKYDELICSKKFIDIFIILTVVILGVIILRDMVYITSI